MTEYRCWSDDVGVQPNEAEKVEATCAWDAATEFIAHVEARRVEYPIAWGREEALVKVAIDGVGDGRIVHEFEVYGEPTPSYGVRRHKT